MVVSSNLIATDHSRHGRYELSYIISTDTSNKFAAWIEFPFHVVLETLRNADTYAFSITDPKYNLISGQTILISAVRWAVIEAGVQQLHSVLALLI